MDKRVVNFKKFNKFCLKNYKYFIKLEIIVISKRRFNKLFKLIFIFFLFVQTKFGLKIRVVNRND